jgi:hypothetical protein
LGGSKPRCQRDAEQHHERCCFHAAELNTR